MGFQNLDDNIREIKSFGNFLMQYSRPKVSQEDDADIDVLRMREITIDGYSLVIHYVKSDWLMHYFEVLQITGKYTPFLPFSLVCKIGKKFLGDKHLSYLDIMKEDRKTYCWNLATDKTNNPIPSPYKNMSLSDDCEYEGLSYKCLNPVQSSDKKF
jgi:hypothetical protein